MRSTVTELDTKPAHGDAESTSSDRHQFYQSNRHESEGDKDHYSDSEMYVTHQHDRYDKRHGHLKYEEELRSHQNPKAISCVSEVLNNLVIWLQTFTKNRSSQTTASFILGVVIGITLTAMLFQHNYLVWGTESKRSEHFFDSGFIHHTVPYEVKLKELNERIEREYLQSNSEEDKDVPVLADTLRGDFQDDSPEKNLPKRIKKEVNVGSKIFVGVITAEKFLRSRAVAVNSTWGSQVDKISFFTELGSSDKYGIPIINLEGVSDKEYPPQKKSFKMLKYMCQNHIDEFDWFVRADDDVYIRVEELKEFLGQIDSDKLIYMGQPGHGVPEVREKLGLNGHNFCMGGPSVIFNRKALKELCSHMDECMAEVVSGEEDVEIGRCVSNHLHIECTHAWETLKLFYHSYQEEYTEERPFLGNLAENIHVQKAITLHHVKLPYIMYKIHRHFTSLLLNASTQEITYLRRQAESLNEHLPLVKHRQLSTIKSPPRSYKAEKLSDVAAWSSFNVEAAFGLSFMSPSRDITNDCLADLKQIGETAIDVAIDSSAAHLTYSHLAGGYFRADPLRGTDYLLDISFSSKEEGKLDEVKRVHILRPLTELQISNIEEYSSEGGIVNLYIVLPIRESASASGDLERFIRKYYESAVLQVSLESMKVKIRPTLIVSMYSDKADSSLESQDTISPSVQDVVNWFRVKYPQSSIEVFPKVNPGDNSAAAQNTYSHNIDFAYMQAILHIARSRSDRDKDVALLSSMKFSISRELLDTCVRRSSLVNLGDNVQDLDGLGKRPKRLYQPIPFALYPGRDSYKAENLPDRDAGYWSVKSEENGNLNMPICGAVSNFISVANSVQSVSSSFIDLLFNNVYDSKFLLQLSPDRNIVG